jgi:succinate dehydrogenase flavin-adding protein (antitoxin of CptAB toxin-antitoxin module)
MSERIGELVVVETRLYATDDSGTPTDPPERFSNSEEHEKRRLRAIVERGQEAEAKLAWEEWRRIREVPQGAREYADRDDPAASAEDNRLYAALVSWKDGTR